MAVSSRGVSVRGPLGMFERMGRTVPDAVNERLLIIEVGGRTGNQLFQFASGLGLAHELDAQLRFCSRKLHHLVDFVLPPMVGPLYREASPAELLRVGEFHYNWKPLSVWQVAARNIAVRARRVRGRDAPNILLDETATTFHPELLDIDLPVYVRGWLQSERYFAAVADQVSAAIQLPADIPNPSDVVSGASVAVHFRRGEFNELKWALPLQYYDTALARLAEERDIGGLVLFGDDPVFVDLACERFERVAPAFERIARSVRDLGQLALMAACDHIVMANSSFSWWAAWLGDQRSDRDDRMVMAPTGYSQGGTRLPERWHQVPSGVVTYAT